MVKFTGSTFVQGLNQEEKELLAELTQTKITDVEYFIQRRSDGTVEQYEKWLKNHDLGRLD